MTFFTVASIPTVPTAACAEYYGNYIDLKVAELSCAGDLDCLSIVDEGCDHQGPFYSCKRHSFTEGSSSRCTDYKKKQGRTFMTIEKNPITVLYEQM